MGINLLTGRIGEISTPQPLVPYQGLPDYTKLLEPLADLDRLKKEDEKNKAAKFKEIERPKVDGVYDALEPIMQKEVDKYYKMHEDFYRKTQGKTSYEIDTDPELNRMYGDLIRAKGNFDAEQLKALSSQLTSDQKAYGDIDAVKSGYGSNYLLFESARKDFTSKGYLEKDPEEYKRIWGTQFGVSKLEQGSTEDLVNKTVDRTGYTAGSSYSEELANAQIVNGKLVLPKIGGGSEWSNNSQQLLAAINSDIDTLMTDNDYKRRNLHEYLNDNPISLKQLSESTKDESIKNLYEFINNQIGSQPVYFRSLNDIAFLLYKVGLGRQPEILDGLIDEVDRATQESKTIKVKDDSGKEEEKISFFGRRDWNNQRLLQKYAPAAKSSFGKKQNIGLQGFGEDGTSNAQVNVVEQIKFAGETTQKGNLVQRLFGFDTVGDPGSLLTFTSAIVDKNTYNRLNSTLGGSTKAILPIGDGGIHTNVDLPPGVKFDKVNNSFGFVDHPGEGNTNIIFSNNGRNDVSVTETDKKYFAFLEKAANGRLTQQQFNKLSSDKQAKYALYLYKDSRVSKEQLDATDKNGNPLRYNKFNLYGQEFYIPQALVARTTFKINPATIESYEDDTKYKAFFDSQRSGENAVGYVYVANEIFDPRNLNK